MRKPDTPYTIAAELATIAIQTAKMVQKMVWMTHKLNTSLISGGSVCIIYEKDVKKHHFGLAKVYYGSSVRTVRFYHMSTGEYIIDCDSGGKKYKTKQVVTIKMP
jgi:hypothetical protein